MIDHALSYGTVIGWPVFPTHSIVDDACSCGSAECGSPGKHPRTRRGVKDATTDEARIREWWEKWPDANIGLATGPVYVIDLDGETGLHSWMKLALTYPTPPTIEIATGGGGRHLYYQSEGVRLGNTAGKLGPGIDTRGYGGYVLAPPSNHKSGKRYEWRRVEGPAALPVWVAQLLTPKRHTPRGAPRFRRDDDSAYGRKTLEYLVDEIRQAPEGQRNETLNTKAFRVGQLIGGGEIRPEGVADQLEDASTDPDREKVHATVQRAIRDGALHPTTRKEARDG